MDDKDKNIFDLGYDKNLNKIDVLREEEAQTRRRFEYAKNERERQELLKLKLITASKKSPVLYSLDIIIEKCLINKTKNQIHIEFFDLGFSDNMTGIRNAKELFISLKKGGCFEDFGFSHTDSNIRFNVIAPDIEKLRDYKSTLVYGQGIKRIKEQRNIKGQKNFPKTIHLVTSNISENDVIFLVIDENFKTPIRFSTKNPKGEDSAVKKLHNLAYIVDVPGKQVMYSERTADNINNGIFKNSQVASYMKTNKLDKPTLVKRSGKILVFKNETLVRNILVNLVPSQYRYLYIDKTK